MSFKNRHTLKFVPLLIPHSRLQSNILAYTHVPLISVLLGCWTNWNGGEGDGRASAHAVCMAGAKKEAMMSQPHHQAKAQPSEGAVCHRSPRPSSPKQREKEQEQRRQRASSRELRRERSRAEPKHQSSIRAPQPTTTKGLAGTAGPRAMHRASVRREPATTAVATTQTNHEPSGAQQSPAHCEVVQLPRHQTRKR